MGTATAGPGALDTRANLARVSPLAGGHHGGTTGEVAGPGELREESWSKGTLGVCKNDYMYWVVTQHDAMSSVLVQ